MPSFFTAQEFKDFVEFNREKALTDKEFRKRSTEEKFARLREIAKGFKSSENCDILDLECNSWKKVISGTGGLRAVGRLSV
jgi:hypothetical protein